MIEKPPIGTPCNGCGLCCLTQVCSTGSLVLGLVDVHGERAAGPCPVLLPKPDGSFSCGLVARPKDYIATDRGVTVVREAVKLMIGAGAGCDEAGDEPDSTFLPKAKRIQEEYLRRHGIEVLQKAAAVVFGWIK